ncbi:MAG: hypothetical protein JOY68_07530 [Candidatus Dormibacteraeota bacterium]|nr:hypothetical protein [Candidatus Dormibacteraeota bacterium]
MNGDRVHLLHEARLRLDRVELALHRLLHQSRRLAEARAVHPTRTRGTSHDALTDARSALVLAHLAPRSDPRYLATRAGIGAALLCVRGTRRAASWTLGRLRDAMRRSR